MANVEKVRSILQTSVQSIVIGAVDKSDISVAVVVDPLLESVRNSLRAARSECGLEETSQETRMADGTASLRHRAFAVKLALRKVAGLYSDMKRARLTDRAPELEDCASAPRLRTLLEQFHEAHERLEKALLEEVVRLSIEAERTVNAYARSHYGFGPGDEIQVSYPSPGNPVRLRVHKVFLQSNTESDIRLDGSFLQTDGTTGSRWDIYMKGPGQFQFDKIQRKRTEDVQV
jgi:hypothetical protein